MWSWCRRDTASFSSPALGALALAALVALPAGSMARSASPHVDGVNGRPDLAVGSARAGSAGDYRVAGNTYRLALQASGTYRLRLALVDPRRRHRSSPSEVTVVVEGRTVVPGLEFPHVSSGAWVLRRTVVSKGSRLDVEITSRGRKLVVSAIKATRVVWGHAPADRLLPSSIRPNAPRPRAGPASIGSVQVVRSGSRTRFSYQLGSPTPTRLGQVLVAIGPWSGRGGARWDTGLLRDITVSGSRELTAFQTLPPGRWVAAPAYSSDGGRWTVGQGMVFSTRPGASRLATALVAPVFDVRDYGAKGDGRSDDSTALRSVLTAAARRGGGTVYLPAGRYVISDWLVYGSNTRIVGIDPSTTTITNTTTRTGSTLMLRPAGYGIHDVLVQGITWDQRGDVYDRSGDAKYDQALDFSNTHDTTVRFCWFRNIRTVGIYADATVAHPSTNLRINDNRVFEAGGDGISIFGRFVDVQINRNRVQHTQDDAIAIQDHRDSADFPTRVEIRGNVIRDCVTRTTYGSTPNGINVWGGDRVIVADNVVERVFTNGLRLGAGSGRRGTDIVATDNVVTGAGTYNTTTDVPGNGVLVIDADGVELARNQVSRSAHLDYRILGSTRVTGP